jgi:hypothetical protein
MKHESDSGKPVVGVPVERGPADTSFHPAWRAFIRYCAELRHGEIELLKIQDGVPVLAERTRQKVKFS